MKWLFAVLVALNIIVFGGTVASRIAEKQRNASAPVQGVDVPQQQQTVPAAVETLHPAAVSAPEWVADSVSASAASAASEPALPASETETDAARLAQEKAEREARQKEAQELEEKNRKEREEKARREQLEKEKAKREQERQKNAEAKKESSQCTSPASVTLNEDDYHRIKGLLRRWPHAASRTVEKREADQVQKTYRVLVSADGDAAAMIDSLAAKGFSGSIHEGSISVGVARSRSAAQVLISRLATAGFGGTRIQEQEEHGASPEGGLSVAKMQVTFMDVDDQSAQEIQKVVSRYGKLSRKACR
ncbi:cell division protein [Neisseria sp.]|uniref:cell division protein n=1 Tax=Neisseria sp. TaxID=192066 RepID=UPI0026DB5AA6|nr:cell division protein [Neisseria sp.]MDO4906367.1 cell division protein [Neisseria sp.]